MLNVTRCECPAISDCIFWILLPLLLSLVFAGPTAALPPPVEPTEPYVNNAFRTVRLMTSRVVITVLGRDPRRQLTTYVNEVGELNFGFPPAFMRQHERGKFMVLEKGIFNRRTTNQNLICNEATDVVQIREIR